MKKFKMITLCIFMLAILFCKTAIPIAAEEITQANENKPLDLVVVVDKSGSMAISDRQQQTLNATNILMKLMPSTSRLGVITFAESADNILADIDNGGLVSLDNSDNCTAIKSKISQIHYDGDWTGMGNGLKEAVDLLSTNGRSDSQKAILLFSDGTDDYGSGVWAEKKLSDCTDRAADAVLWAKNNQCPIYCIGYDYDGSMSSGSEGFTKLSDYAGKTGGEAQSITNIGDIQTYFNQILLKLTGSNPGNINSDGSFEIDSTVVEANITIIGNESGDFSQIELYNPSGERIELKDSDTVRYSVEGNVAIIKLILPVPGRWQLKNVDQGNYQVSLINYQSIDIYTAIKYPEGNPVETAYQGDTINVSSYLVTDGVQNKEPALYKTVTSATLTAVPMNDPEKKQVVDLVYSDFAFNGAFTINENSTYNVTVQLSSNSFTRKSVFTIESSNHPPILTGEIKKVAVLKNKEKTIDNIYQYVTDPEGDTIKASVSVGDLSISDIELNGNSLTVKGKKWGSTTATIQFQDSHGNIVESTFKVKVIDLLAIILIAGVIILIIVIACLLIYFSYKASLRIKGRVLLENIHLEIEGKGPSFTLSESDRNHESSFNFIFHTKTKTLDEIIKNIIEKFEYRPEDSPLKEIFNWSETTEGKNMLNKLDMIKLKGTVQGNKGVVFILPKKWKDKNCVVRINHASTGKCHVQFNQKMMIDVNDVVNQTNLRITFYYYKIVLGTNDSRRRNKKRRMDNHKQSSRRGHLS